MLDPVTAMGVAANVVQFVDFTVTLISKTRSIYRSDFGRPKEYLSVQIIADDLSQLSLRLGQDLSRLPGLSGQLSDSDQALNQLSLSCATEAQRLRHALDKLQRSTEHPLWSSFKVALRTVWKPEEISDLMDNMDRYRKALDTKILVSLRNKIDLASMQQSEEFKRLNGNVKFVIDLLMENQKGFMSSVQVKLGEMETNMYRQMQTQTTLLYQRKVEAPLPEGLSTDVHDPNLTTRDWNATLQNSILTSLAFESMSDRQQGIHDADDETLQWAYHDPENPTDPFSSFRSWLLEGSGIYWISGKVGSGKSTLMKRLVTDPRSLEFLSEWSPDPIIASFFFWRAGNDLQRKQIGLLRSILHAVLLKKRGLIPIVLPHQWHAWDTKQLKGYSWTLEQLTGALKVIFGGVTAPTKICLFVDGLDEFLGERQEGDYSELITLFETIAKSANVKCCLSSRPLNAFEQAFGQCPGLELQYLTSRDIKNYAKKRLNRHARMMALEKDDPQLGQRLVDEIATRSAGVFLWVVLVVAGLERSLENEDNTDHLEKRLAAYPYELDELYMSLLFGAEAFYKSETSQILQIVQYCAEPPIETLVLSFALGKIDDSVQAKIGLISVPDKLQRCKQIEKWLKSRCMGLLEIRVSKNYHSHMVDTRDGPLVASRVEYLHRTVHDFLAQEQLWIQICNEAHDLFDPHAMLLAGFLRKFKGRPLFEYLINGYRELQVTVSALLEYAARIKAGPALLVTDYTLMIDEVDRTASSHWRTMLATEGDTLWRTYWASGYMMDPSGPNTKTMSASCILQLAEQRGITWYVREKRSKHYQEINNIAQAPIITFDETSCSMHILGVELDRKGADKKTPWMRLLQHMIDDLPSKANVDDHSVDQCHLWLWLTTFQSLLRQTKNSGHPQVQKVQAIFKPWFPGEVAGIASSTKKYGRLSLVFASSSKSKSK